jgi:hypothetical protein
LIIAVLAKIWFRVSGVRATENRQYYQFHRKRNFSLVRIKKRISNVAGKDRYSVEINRFHFRVWVLMAHNGEARSLKPETQQAPIDINLHINLR